MNISLNFITDLPIIQSMKTLIFIFLLLFTKSSYAEYRVFELEIEEIPPEQPPQNTENPDQSPPKIRRVISTLDPLQYPSYYPLKSNEKISYTETWRCFGNTNNFKTYCPNPKINQNLASQDPTQEPLPARPAEIEKP